MAVPTPLVEIGFDLTETGTGPFFRLDDPVRGVLDNTEWLLGGTLFYDVTDYARSIAIKRGKNQALNQYEAGLANVVFNNNTRIFDPVYAASPYYTQIIPKRQIRISSGGELQFYGLIDDWNLTYSPDGDSLASAACSDAFTSLATQTLAERTNSVQLSGDRLNTILSLPEIDWPLTERNIETGAMELGADTIAVGTNALDYIRLISRSEPGSFFISKEGHIVYRDRRTGPSSGGLVFANDGSGIPFNNLQVQYGSELLYNEIVVYSALLETGFQANATDSINEYGVFNLTREGLLINSDADLEAYGRFLASKFSEPEYRFESLQIVVDQRTPSQQADLLGLELGDVVQIKFTPNGVSPAIEKYAEIISINNTVDSTNHVMTLGFATLDFALLVLDDAEFGKLDNGNALAF